MEESDTIAIIGLGYVGLPLAVEFAKKTTVIGFDINNSRINDLILGIDKTLEINKEVLNGVLVNQNNFLNNKKGLILTSDSQNLKTANIFIITVPTPTDKNNRPILKPLINASKLVGNVLNEGDIVIYESTVYPGVTEDECVPILENISGLIINENFSVGYSPERISPGDKRRTLTKIMKVTSGSNLEAALKIDRLYKSIITAGTYLAPSIKIAEASKVIENSQRDINIAFINEIAKIFNILEIDTLEVIKAAQTKWNFLPFKPGLVGGHCIGVDPFYIAQKAQEVGYYPEIILAGRRLNDSMGKYVANQLIKLMIKNDIKIKDSKILILGVTFKENCPDIRNTRVVDVINELHDFETNITAYDPWVSPKDAENELSVTTTNILPKEKFDGIMLAVSHDKFKEINIEKLKNNNCAIYDIKGFLDEKNIGRL